MPPQSFLFGFLYAFTASISWGAGDFCGGLASRRQNQYQVLFLASTFSLILLIVLAVTSPEGFPSPRDCIISILAGFLGALGLAALYFGLSRGAAALIAPVAGVVGAIIPILVGIGIHGSPGRIPMLGFVFALFGIGVVSRSGGRESGLRNQGLFFGLLAGLGFGGFLALMPQVNSDQIFTPLAFAKLSGVLVAIVLIRSARMPAPKLSDNPLALLTGLLDTGGNLFYLAGAANARLDLVAVVSSLYPAFTVLLSSLILKERVSRLQWLGILACVIAIGLLTA